MISPPLRPRPVGFTAFDSIGSDVSEMLKKLGGKTPRFTWRPKSESAPGPLERRDDETED